MRPNGNHGGGNNFNRRPRNNHGNSNQGGGNNRSGGNAMRRPQQPTNLRNQIFDSHGPNGERVRGNAFQVHEKYQSLARDAEERVDQEAYSQHAEHYYRIVEAIQEMEAERNARFGGQPSEGAQPRQQGGYNSQSGERNDSYGGDQPDLPAPAPAEGEARNEPQPQQRPRYNRDSGRDGNRDAGRDGTSQNRGARDEQASRQARDEQSSGQAPDEQPRRQPRSSVQERPPLEPIDHSEDNDSGPIFSLAADAPPSEPVEAVAPPPRRRGRPAKTEAAE